MNAPPSTQASEAATSSPSRKPLVVALALAALVVVSFWPVSNASYIRFDDPEYVFENAHVLSGLNSGSLAWAFTTYHAANWHPITWLSLMLDVQLLGADPGVFHLSALIWHAINTVLLFFLLRRLTGAFWRSAFVAALFAVHPLHVESVAWISERKDLLSTFFLLLTIWAYANYVTLRQRASAHTSEATPQNPWYWFAGALLLFALGLMAKPMVVTLPFVLLLLDHWPLRRWSVRTASHLVLEKAPFLFLSAISCFVTVVAQSKGEAVKSLHEFPFLERLGNASVSYVRYLWKTVWPLDLAIFYPHPGAWPVGLVVVAILFVVGMSLAAWNLRHRHGWLFTGWFWYVGMLVPVLGVVQVGIQSMADRYSYVPLIGIFILGTWAVGEWGRRRVDAQGPLRFLAVLILIVCTGLTWRQSSLWLNDETLFSHALRVTKDNVLAHNNLADYLLRQGRPAEAIPHFKETLRLQPNYYYAANNLGSALTQIGRYDEALASIRRALELNPRYALSHLNLADTLTLMGKFPEAHQSYARAVELDPRMAAAYNNWGGLFFRENRFQEAVEKYEVAVKLSPNLIPAWGGLARSLTSAGALPRAAAAYAQAITLAPESPRFRVDAARVLLQLGRTNDALQELSAAVTLEPGYRAATELLQSLGARPR